MRNWTVIAGILALLALPAAAAPDRADAEAGRALYGAGCANCHGLDLQGAAGPALTGTPFRSAFLSPGRTPDDLVRAIAERMPPAAPGSLSPAQARSLATYLLQRNDATASVPAAPRPNRFPVAPTAAKSPHSTQPADAELVKIRPEDWPGFNRDLNGQRFSPLRQITARNAHRLAPVCLLQLGDGGSFQSGPLVYQGRLYVTTAHKTVAVDAATCTRLWEHVYAPTDAEPWPGNRGVALSGGRLFRGTTDGHLIALDAATGELLWDAWVADSRKHYHVSGAPLAYGGRVFVGEAGGDYGLDGHIHAFDAATGRPLWSFDTIAYQSRASWPADIAFGGGGSWSAMSFDVASDTLLVPVGNPWPDYDGAMRQGDNLYTNSVVALDAATGERRWHLQQVPHDTHDWDTPAPPVLYAVDGKPRLAVLSKDGHLYLYDAASRALLARPPVSTIKNADAPFSAAGTHVCPGIMGGGQFNGPAFGVTSHQLFVSSVDWCHTFYAPETSKRPLRDPIEQASGWIRAFDAASGQENWAYHSPTPMMAGVTPTAGGVVFTGDLNGMFLALDAASGKVLYRFATGGAIAGGVISYAVQDKQYVAVASGSLQREAWLTAGSPTLVVFALP